MMSLPHRRYASLAKASAPVLESLETRRLFTTFNPTDGAGLSSALVAAELGDTIILNAGTTYTGNFVMTNKTAGTGWITIQSSNLAALPAGVRVSPADVAKMPKVIAGSGLPAIRTEYGAAVGAHHFKLIGIEFAGPANNSDLTNLVELGTTDSIQNTLAEMPHDFLIDRCYIHANITDAVNNLSSQHLRRGIALNSGATDITNCYISEIHDVGSGDSQAIGGSNGSGPYNILNNHLEAASENILFGGSNSFIPNTIPSDIVIRGNHFIKPLAWRGVWAQVKNLFELKVGARILVEQNLFENCWNAAQDGTAINIKLAQWSSARPWTVTEDVTFRNNIVRHAAKGVVIQGRDYDNNSPQGNVRRINFNNNLFDDIKKTPWADWSGNSNLIGGNFLYMTHGPVDVTFDHNTTTAPRLVVTVDQPSYLPTNFVFTNNITMHGTYGIFSSDGGTGNNTITEYFNDGTPAQAQARMTKNVLMGGNSGSYSTRPGNFFPSSWASVGFTDQANGNFALTAASAYHNAGTDGKDLGPDFSQVFKDFAYMTGTTLNVIFDPDAPLPIQLTTNAGGAVAASYDQSEIDFTGVTAINVVGTAGDDRLQLSATTSLPITFANGTGNDLVEVLSGAQTFTGDIGGAGRNVALTVAAGAAATFNSNQHLRFLTVNGAATLSSGGNKVLLTKALTLTGKLNLTDNDLVLDYTGASPIGSWSGSAYNGIAGLIASGLNAGAWNGNGIVTDRSAALAGQTTLGIAEAKDALGNTGSATALFGTETVDSTAILVKYTYGGDANLDGVINPDDYANIGFNDTNPNAHGYFNGDFNYDGDINADDFALIDFMMSAQGGPL